MPTFTIMPALTTPTSVPKARPATMASGQGTSMTRRLTAASAAKSNDTPTERSMPPAVTTRVMASATNIRITLWLAMLSMFSTVAKRSAETEKKTTTRMKAIQTA